METGGWSGFTKGMAALCTRTVVCGTVAGWLLRCPSPLNWGRLGVPAGLAGCRAVKWGRLWGSSCFQGAGLQSSVSLPSGWKEVGLLVGKVSAPRKLLVRELSL